MRVRPIIERSRTARVVPLVLGALLVLLAPLAQARAQDGEDDAGRDPGAILFTRAAVVFPAAIQFVIGVDAAPDALARITLTVTQGGETLFVNAGDPAAYEQRDAGLSTELIATWALDHPPYPRPFAPLAYEWAVETGAGERLAASGEVEVIDPRFEWQTAGAPPLTLHWHNASLGGRRIVAELAPVLAALRAQTGAAAAFELVIYDPGAPLCPPVTDPGSGQSAPGVLSPGVLSPENGQVFDCSVAQHARAYENAGIIFVQRPSLGYTELRDRLAVRLAQDTYAALWSEAGAEVPAWFAAGLATLYRPRGDAAALELVRAALKDGSALPVEALDQALPADAPLRERELWQAQSAVLVRALSDRYGAGAPFEIARALAAGESFDGALAALDDTLPAGLWETWEQWTGFQEAERAAAWTLYQTATPVPTALPTATPSPTPRPSVTPSRTPAPAPSLTPTLLGHFAPDVIAMQAPATEPLPPTNTPLPPGSLPSVTPRAAPAAPVPASVTRLDTTATLGVALLVSGGALLLIALGLLLRRR